MFDIDYLFDFVLMDFYVWFEVFIDGEWCIFDVCYNIFCMGCVLIVQGCDVFDVVFIIFFGSVKLVNMKVWVDEMDFDNMLDIVLNLCIF